MKATVSLDFSASRDESYAAMRSDCKLFGVFITQSSDRQSLLAFCDGMRKLLYAEYTEQSQALVVEETPSAGTTQC